MHKLFEMIKETLHRVSANFRICCRDLGGGGSKLQMLAQECTVSALSVAQERKVGCLEMVS